MGMWAENPRSISLAGHNLRDDHGRVNREFPKG
jgi:hypothetical protein